MLRYVSWSGCLLFVLVLYARPAAAQQQAAPAGAAAAHPRYGTKPPLAAGDWNVFSGIDLTRDQQEHIRTLSAARRQQLFLLFEKGRHPDNRAAVADSIALVQRARLAEVRAMLTPAQQARFDLNVASIVARAQQVRASATSNR